MKEQERNNILLVEDDAITSMVERRTLEKYGFIVEPVFSGEDAVDYCRADNAVDLVLMDIDLGRGMDGTEAARIIIEERGLPVLFLSSHTEPEVVAKTETITSYGYVVKNSGETVLVASIRMAFRLHDATLKLQQKTLEMQATNEELEATNEELISSQNEIIIRESLLKESEERFRAILNATRDIILVADASTRMFLYGNSSSYRMLGYSESEITSIGVTDIHPREKIGEVIEAFSKFATREIEMAPDIPVMRKDGSIFFTDISAYPVVLNGRDTLVGVFHDITERKAAQEAVAAERNFVSAAMDSLPSLFYLFDEQGNFLRWNINFEKVSGYSPDEISRMNPFDFFDKKGKPPIELGIRQTFETGQGSAEADFISKDGTRTPCLFTGRVFNFEGRRCLIGMGVDISERKAAQDAITTERNFISAVLDSVPGLLYLYDSDGHLRRWNRNHETQTGYSHDELDGMFIFDWFDPDDRETVDIRQGVERAFRDGYASATGLLLTKSKEKIPYYFTAVRLEIQGREYITGIGIDITERVKAEQAYARAVEEKDSLFQELQHRIKNSLSMIIALINLEADKVNDPTARQSLETLIGRVHVLSNLYTILYSGNEGRNIRLDHYLEEIAQSIRTGYSVGAVSLNISLENISVDAKKASSIGLILNELLTNSLKHAFIGRSGGTIDVMLKTKDGAILLEVADDGVGLPANFSISSSRGLGLAMVNMIIQQLGGEVRFESGNKTRFTICLNSVF